MINKNSPIFIACRPSGIIAILLAFFIAILLSNNASAANLVVNGDFETGDSSNWGIFGTAPTYSMTVTDYADYSGTYGARVYAQGGPATNGHAMFKQTIDLTNVNNLTLWYKVVTYGVGYQSSGSFAVGLDGDAWHSVTEVTDWSYVDIDVSSYSGDNEIMFSAGGAASAHGAAGYTIDAYFDVVVADEDIPSVNSIVFNPNVSISNQSQQYFDYNVNDTWDDYYYFVRSIWEPETYNLYLNENWLNIDMSGENVKLLYEFICYQSNYSLELYATTYPTFDIGYAHLIAESPIILYDSDYIPAEEPEEPEEPEIPDPEPEPDPEPNPPIPPTQPNETGANQSINVSWTGEYYNTVNNTIGGLCSPLYNFTNWSLSPIYSLNDSVGEFNYHMNESFTQTAQDSSILYESINIIFGAIHPKIRNVITYYLIWVVLLIILKKD